MDFLRNIWVKKSRKSLFFILLFLESFFLFEKTSASDQKNIIQSSGSISLSSYCSEPGTEIHNISVNQKVEISQGGLSVIQGQPVNFSYNPDKPAFSMGGGVYPDKNGNGEWVGSLADADNCSASTIQYDNVGPSLESYQFKLCAVQPTVSMTSSNSGVIFCSGMNCTAVGPGMANVQAQIGLTALKVWGKNITNGSGWSTVASPNFVPTSALSWDITVVGPPAINFTASSTNINYGTSATLNWTVTDATSCEADPTSDWSGSKPLSGSFNTGNLYSNKNYILKCTGPAGITSKVVQITVGPPNPAPTLSFSASPSQVEPNSSTTLNWSTTNASICVASGDWTGDKTISGSENTGNLTVNKTYSLQCTGSGGSVSQNFTVSVIATNYPPPNVTFSAAKTTVISGSSTTLSWSSTDASSCTASGDWSGSKGTSGSESTGNLNADRSYTLTCVGPGGTSSQTRDILVVLPINVDMWADSINLPYGGQTTLHWTSTNATYCRSSWAGYTNIDLAGERITPALYSTTYPSVTCYGPGGSMSKNVKLTVASPSVPPTVNFTADSYSVPYDTTTTLRWTTTDAGLCSGSGAWSYGKTIPSGSETTPRIVTTTNFILTCSNASGSTAKTVTITVADPPVYTDPPIFTFYADKYNLDPGQGTWIHWRTTNATYCQTAGGDWQTTGYKSLNGDFSVYPSSTKTYVLTCGNNVRSETRTVTINVADFRLDFTADVNPVVYNTATILRWNGIGMTSCVASGDWIGNKAVSGSETTVKIISTKNYTLSCQGPMGTIGKTLTINSAGLTEDGPSMSFWADNFYVSSGGSTTLRWTSTNATSCVGSGVSNWNGSKPLSGSQSFSGYTTDIKYILTCSNASGGIFMEVTIKVGATAGPTLIFWADKFNVDPGSTTTLHWNSTGATSCLASGAWSGAKTLSGSADTLPINTLTDYNLSCSGPGGNVNAVVKIGAGASNYPPPDITWITPSGFHFTPGTTLDYVKWSVTPGTSSCLAKSVDWTTYGGIPIDGDVLYQYPGSTGITNITIGTNPIILRMICEGAGGIADETLTIAPANLIVCPKKTQLQVGESQQLDAFYGENIIFDCGPSASGAQNVTQFVFPDECGWSSSSGAVSVNNATNKGLVKGESAGTANITAKYRDITSEPLVMTVTDKIKCWKCKSEENKCEENEYDGNLCPIGDYAAETDCAAHCLENYFLESNLEPNP